MRLTATYAERMDRLLGPLEKVVYQMDRAAPLNFTTVARVRGPLSLEAVRAGLDAVSERHPYLRARIREEARGEPTFRSGGLTPSLRQAGGGDWIAEAEREVTTHLPAETGPLVRCVVVEHGAEDHSLLLTFHHSIGDGMSGVYLVRDLLTATAAVSSGSAPSLAPLSDTRAMDDRLPGVAQGLGGWLRRQRFFLRELGYTLRHGKPVKVRRDREAFAYERRARLIHEVLDEAFAGRLAERARAEGTTVHGALSAAMLLGVLHDAGVKGRARVMFGSPVNVRKQLEPEVGEDIGLYAAMLAFNGPVSVGEGLWSVARAIRAATAADLARGEALVALGLMDTIYGLLGGDRLEPRELAERWEKAMPTTTGLTNLGRLDVETRYGELALESLHFLASPSVLGDFISTATSLNGRLFWNFVWTDPVMTPEHARGLVSDMVARLRRGVDG